MTTGKLLVVGKKNTLKVEFVNKKDKSVSMLPAEAELSEPLLELKRTNPIELNGLAVEFQEIQGQPCKIHEVGQTWISPATTKSSDRTRSSDTSQQTQPTSSSLRGDFHNPYNFIPTLPCNVDHPELGHGRPIGHGMYHGDRWSGCITAKLETITPLLIPDAGKAAAIDIGTTAQEKHKHKIYPLRVDTAGNPYLPPTSIKGMLRSAYEAITNSRLSIFEKHSDRLFYRMSATDGLSLVPAVVENGHIRLMSGTTKTLPEWNGRRWHVPVMYAAWIPQYNQNRRGQDNIGYPNMRHGDRVRVWLEKYHKTNREGRPIFTYWKVRRIVPIGQSLGDEPQPSNGSRNHQPTSPSEIIPADGFLCITGRNIERKHDERVFFCKSNSLVYEQDCAALNADWEYLIKNYQDIHKGEDREEGYEWSRHVSGGERECQLSSAEDERPTLCYAFVEKTGKGLEIQAVYPVMISRAIYDLSPQALLAPELRPAKTIEELSPADRVFGWVNQDEKGKGAYKGHVRISAVQCDTKGAIEDLTKHEVWKETQGMPLAILGEPKPQQSRFYTAADPNGTALKAGLPKAEGYKKTGQKGLRGRKVYPHHKLPKNYWAAASKELEFNNRYREYFHPKQEQTTQNRTIQAWVKPETSFSFDMHINNLSNVELGALLWLLTLSGHHPEHYHRLGAGKPLGFGSVNIDITAIDVHQGRWWTEYYCSLTPLKEPEPCNTQQLIDEFEQALQEAYGSQCQSFLQAFLKAAQGFDKPIHSPRTYARPDSEEESFKWFVNNEKEGRNGGHKLPLPNLIDDQGLPLDPTT